MTTASSTPAIDPPPGADPEFAASVQPLRPIPPRRAGRLGDTVVAYLVDRIVSGVHPPDSTLPIEPELCEEFGVSRTVVRESIKLLEEKGLVKATPGRGTTVLEPDSWNLLDPVVLEAEVRHDQDLSILDDLVDVRIALECSMTAAAAHKITAVHVAALARQIEQLGAVMHDPDRHAAEDAAFHDLIMTASGNRLGHAIVRSIHGKARMSTLYTGAPTPAGLEQSLAEHQEIYTLIAKGDGPGAAAAMRAHILESWAKRRPGIHLAASRADEA